MPGKLITEFDNAGNLQPGDFIPIARGTTTLKLSGNQLVTKTADGNFTLGAGIVTGLGANVNEDCRIELGSARTTVGHSYIDFHSTVGTDYEARLARWTGANGGLTLTNTGTGNLDIWQTSAGKINLATSNIPRITIDSFGYVGIGQLTPTKGLHISGNEGVSSKIALESIQSAGYTGVDGPEFIFQHTGSGAGGYVKINDVISSIKSQGYVTYIGQVGYQPASEIKTTATGNFNAAATRSADISISSVNAGTFAEKLRIKSDGKVGIGTSAPSMMLHVKSSETAPVAGGAGTSQLLLSNSATNPSTVRVQVAAAESDYNPLVKNNDQTIIFSGGSAGSTSSNLVIGPHSSTVAGMRITSEGSIGIGTSSPNQKLTVVGNVSATGTIYGNGSGLTNIFSTDVTRLPLAGGTLTGGLTGTNAFFNFIKATTSTFTTSVSAPALSGSFYGTHYGNGSGLTNVTGTDATKLPLAGGTLTGNLITNSKVGIKTTAPTDMLHVAANDGTFATATRPTGWGGGITTWDLYAGGTVGLGTATGNLSAYINKDGNAFFNGNVGIGTSAPASKLHVFGNANTVLLESNDQETVIDFKNNSTNGRRYRLGTGGSAGGLGGGIFGLYDVTASTMRLAVTKDGNIGIGTTAPQDKLHIEGCIRLGKYQGIRSVDDTTNTFIAGGSNYDKGGNITLIGPSNSTNPGIITFATGVGTQNGERVRIDKDGNVGIGTSTPSQKLTVAGNVSSTGIYYGNGSGLTNVSGTDSTKLPLTGGSLSGGLNVAGNVGIGISNPTYKLEVTGNVAINNSNYALLRLGNESATGWLITKESSDNSFNIWQNAIIGSSTNRFFINSSGNVGIGTTTPSAKLHVAGTVSAYSFNGDGSGLSNVPGVGQGYIAYLPDKYASGGGIYTNDSFGFIDNAGVVRVAGNTGGHNKFGNTDVYGTPFGTLPLPNGQLARKLYITSNHVAVITTSNELYMTGRNSEGQCGIGNTTSPVQTLTKCIFPAGTQIAEAIITNEDHGSTANTIYALTTDGKLYAWGYNQYGSIGDGTQTARSTPVLVLGPGNTYGNPTSNVVQVVSLGGYDGGSHPISTAARLADGTVWCVGYGGVGQIGNANTNSVISKFSKVGGLPNGVTKIGGIGYDAYVSFYALASDGKLYGWGYNGYGQLGQGNTTNKSVAVSMLTTNFQAGATIQDFWPVGGATRFAIFVKGSDGYIYACGRNNYGQLGLGNTTDRSTLTRVVSLDGTSCYKIVGSFSGYTTYALCDGLNQLYVTGHNGQGQLGLGDTTDRNTFTSVRVYDPSGIKDCVPVYNDSQGGYAVLQYNSGNVYVTGQSRYGMFAQSANNVTYFKKINSMAS